jgi:hypothetical protein
VVGEPLHPPALYRRAPRSAIAAPQQLDLARLESYMTAIPFNRFSGGALVRASVFRLDGVST